MNTKFNKIMAVSLISLYAINAVSPSYSVVYAQKNEVQNFETIPKVIGNKPKENTNKRKIKKENKTLKTKINDFWKTIIKEGKENPGAYAVTLAAFAAWGVYFFYLFGNNNGSKFSTAKTQNLKQEKNFEEEQRLINERVEENVRKNREQRERKIALKVAGLNEINFLLLAELRQKERLRREASDAKREEESLRRAEAEQREYEFRTKCRNKLKVLLSYFRVSKQENLLRYKKLCVDAENSENSLNAIEKLLNDSPVTRTTVIGDFLLKGNPLTPADEKRIVKINKFLNAKIEAENARRAAEDYNADDLFAAIDEDNITEAEKIITQKPELVNYVERAWCNNSCPIYHAAAKGNPKMVRMLLEHDADVSKVDCHFTEKDNGPNIVYNAEVKKLIDEACFRKCTIGENNTLPIDKTGANDGATIAIDDDYRANSVGKEYDAKSLIEETDVFRAVVAHLTNEYEISTLRELLNGKEALECVNSKDSSPFKTAKSSNSDKINILRRISTDVKNFKCEFLRIIPDYSDIYSNYDYFNRISNTKQGLELTNSISQITSLWKRYINMWINTSEKKKIDYEEYAQIVHFVLGNIYFLTAIANMCSDSDNPMKKQLPYMVRSHFKDAGLEACGVDFEAIFYKVNIFLGEDKRISELKINKYFEMFTDPTISSKLLMRFSCDKENHENSN
ncbi:hypothetical protein FACS189465_0530 [Clostridia bacterium]|nr:hypothetical protein FACS189465_0530 [Clostridia bacterium]